MMRQRRPWAEDQWETMAQRSRRLAWRVPGHSMKWSAWLGDHHGSYGESASLREEHDRRHQRDEGARAVGGASHHREWAGRPSDWRKASKTKGRRKRS